MVSDYQPNKIEPFWQKVWEKKKIYSPDLKNSKKPFYNLMMFPYPSAEGLHVGNMYAFTGADIYGRFQRMRGFNVFQPIGLDGFGIHSENYALKIGQHPKKLAQETQKNFYRQLKATGSAYDWTKVLETYDPDYYRWTQWIFIQMYKNGLAYRKKAPVNWCPQCQTVLADEQAEGGFCERCQSPVTLRELEQWFFKITQYADRLLGNLPKINWPPKVKQMQKNWIGRSLGVEIDFVVKGQSQPLTIFTTRPETLLGVTFIAVAPKHQLAGKQVRAVHPLTKKEIPVFTADYVLEEYGRGAVMGVPAYDERDLAFARQNKIPVRKTPLMDRDKVVWKLIKLGVARKKVNYHLRDWLISRQRYWGPPIPMINCQKCGWLAAPEKDLPIKLPNIKNWKPTGTGKAPLANVPEFVKTKCPQCQGPARRETDVSDTFLDSSWYFLAYPNLKTKAWQKTPNFFNSKISRRWLPVNFYIGGAEHSVLHLLYSRFVTMALCDWGFLWFEEPFPFFYAHGLIIKQGAKMSKSKGNVVVPDDYIKKYGADTLRMYLMFIGPFNQGGDFQDKGITGISRFLHRIYRLYKPYSTFQVEHGSGRLYLKRKLHQTIKKVSEDIKNLKFNTAIAAMMEFVNEAYKEKTPDSQSGVSPLSLDEAELFLRLLAPFAPHLAEELWQELKVSQKSLALKTSSKPGFKNSVHLQPWPKYNPKLAQAETAEFIIQVNGKVRDKFKVQSSHLAGGQAKFTVQDKAVKTAKESEKARRYLKGKKIKKIIFVPNRLINFVTSP